MAALSQPTAVLRTPPCPDLVAVGACAGKVPTTFAEWNRKVSEKYERDKKKGEKAERLQEVAVRTTSLRNQSDALELIT